MFFVIFFATLYDVMTMDTDEPSTFRLIVITETIETLFFRGWNFDVFFTCEKLERARVSGRLLQ